MSEKKESEIHQLGLGDPRTTDLMRSPHYAQFTSNRTEFWTSPWDMQFNFLLVASPKEQVDKSVKLPVHEQGLVSISHAHAVRFANTLVRQILAHPSFYDQEKVQFQMKPEFEGQITIQSEIGVSAGRPTVSVPDADVEPTK